MALRKPFSRRVKAGTNVSLVVLFALGCWVLIGWINQRHYHRFDTTANRAFSLSEKTISILDGLDKPLTITTLFRPGTNLERNAKDMLDEYGGRNKRITLVRIDPDRDAAKVELLAKRLKMDSFQLNSVVFEMDGKAKQVAPSEMEELEPGSNPFMPSQTPPKFKGEEAFTSAILNLTLAKAPIIYCTTGHGERDFEGTDPAGISEWVKYMKRENMEVRKISTLAQGDIPADADCLILADPKQKFLQPELERIDAYLKRGGKLLALLDPMQQTGLEEFLQHWGVEVGNDVVLDPVRRLFFAGPAMLVVDDFSSHAIVQKLQGSAALLSLARSVQPMKDAKGDVAILLKTSKEAWGETDTQIKQAKWDSDVDKMGPISLGVAVSKPSNGADARLVVFGDSDFITNGQLGNASNMDLVSNAVNWLTRREKLISIGPKIQEQRQLTLNAAQMQMIFWFTVLGMPLGGIIAGSAVWYRRRK